MMTNPATKYATRAGPSSGTPHMGGFGTLRRYRPIPAAMTIRNSRATQPRAIMTYPSTPTRSTITSSLKVLATTSQYTVASASADMRVHIPHQSLLGSLPKTIAFRRRYAIPSTRTRKKWDM